MSMHHRPEAGSHTRPWLAFLFALLLALGGLSVVGCSEDDVGDDMDEAMEEIQDEADDARDEIEDEIDDLR